MAGKHTFVVPDEHHARALADAFVAFGFPLVTASPRNMSGLAPDRDQSGADWTVTAVDEGPYAMDAQGSREWTATSRTARRLARERRGYFLTGLKFDISQLAVMGRPHGLLIRENPGARPARPAPGPGAAPVAHASVGLDCEPPRGGNVDLGGLHGIPWATLEHAYGHAGDVPALIEGLARHDDEWNDLLSELMGMMLHQGSCYSATSHVIPFLGRLIGSDALSAGQRADLHMDLLYAATRYGNGLITDADRAAAHGRRPSPAPWTAEVRDAVKAITPALLTRWDREPSMVQVLLSALAGLFPRQGAALRDEIARLADRGLALFSDLLLALVDGDAGRIVRSAELLVDGLGVLDPADLDAPALPAEITVTNIVWNTCLCIANQRAG